MKKLIAGMSSVAFWFVAGCGGMASLKSYTANDVKAADDAGDVKTLEGVCSGKLKEEDFSGAKQSACARLDLRAKKGTIAELEKKSDVEGLHKLCMDTKELLETRKEACGAKARALEAEFTRRVASCDGLRETWAWRAGQEQGDPRKVTVDPAYDNAKINQAAQAAYFVAFKKYVECGLWNEAFEDLLGYFPGGWAAGIELPKNSYVARKALAEQKAAGVDVEAKVAEYLQKAGAKPFPNNHAGAVGELAAFLVEQQAFKMCPRLAALAAKDDAETIHEWLPFFTAANCKEGRAVAVLNLVAELPIHRSAACEALGTIGTKAELPKVKAVAEGDGHNVIKKKVQLYPVRDKCSSAATKIQVRGK